MVTSTTQQETAMQLYHHPFSPSARRWLAGDGVSLADYAAAAPLMYKEQARLPLDDYPHLLAWFARVRELPAWQRTTPAW
ncbi:glutathione S-transferase family protein [Massilia kyonggiensis]|nr:glutathione S-transferase family protein [Massilia kyonggiensis]